MEQRRVNRDAPITETELDEWEARARAEGSSAPDVVLRLIAEVRRLRRTRSARIVRSPGRCGGAPTLAGTRIGVADVIALARRYDWDMEQVRAREFPDRSLADLMAAVRYYRAHAEEIDEILRRDRESFERLPPAPLGR